ncbi:hypothetical protein LTR53_011250, partial [Teratosphaeriaceae sp. CCFEE 6253]
MNQLNSATNKRQQASGIAGSSFTGKTGTTGPCDPQFEQLLIDHGIYPHGYEDPTGMLQNLRTYRSSGSALQKVEAFWHHLASVKAPLKQLQRTNRAAS